MSRIYAHRDLGGVHKIIIILLHIIILYLHHTEGKHVYNNNII